MIMHVRPAKSMVHISYSIFPKFINYTPYFRKIYKFSLYSFSLRFSLLSLTYVFSSPYFAHDAFMRHTLHVVLDDPVQDVYS